MKFFWFAAAIASLAIIGAVCVRSMFGPLNADFTMFWTLRELAYPPPYLLLIKPLTYLPYGIAFTLWISLTCALYLIAIRGSKWPALANPAATFNGLIGQNGFLTGAIMFAGLRDLVTSPWRGGAILGLMIIKPHLALVLPVAAIGARAWKAILAAVATVVILLAVAFLVFGHEAYANFLELNTKYGQFVGGGAWNWNELASFYALARWLGLEGTTAWGIHAAVAIVAAAAVWLAWRGDWETKVPLTAAAALLISPYLFTYDAVLLTLALGCLRAPKALAVWALLFIPLVRVFVHEDLPNTTSLAAAFAVGAIVLERRDKLALLATRRTPA